VSARSASALERIIQFAWRKGDYADQLTTRGIQFTTSGLQPGEPLSKALSKSSPAPIVWAPTLYREDPFAKSLPARVPGPPVDPFTGRRIDPDTAPTATSSPSGSVLPPPGQLKQTPAGCTINPNTFQFSCPATFR
jgi:hypothetical protein